MFAQPSAQALEDGRLLFAKECNFIFGAAALDALPPAGKTEVAFAGRSNVGKSSLLNALTGRKALARTSQTPGRTRQINFFDLDGRLILADLPGYGFARASKKEAAAWNALVFDYLRGRPSLRRVMLLIDSRRGIMPADREVMALMDKAAVSYQLILTKVDKLGDKALKKIGEETLKESQSHGAAYPELVATSSESSRGIGELRAVLAGLAEPATS
jgi:GTP-binding protein